MTGFGAGSAATKSWKVAVEMSSVNRKQLDVNLALPRNLMMLDALVQGLVRKAFSRGRISGIIRVEAGENTHSVALDESLAREYIETVRAVAKKLDLPDNLGAESLLKVKGLLGVQQADWDVKEVSEVVGEALNIALAQLGKMRLVEGKALEVDLLERVVLLEGYMKEIQTLSKNMPAQYREKLLARIAEANLGELANDDRILKEIALFADRCDISEELVRLKSHLAQTRELLRASEPVGRTLDFLCQELFREINTIGSKANEVAITKQVVLFKTELERIREQVQNIE
jgi:uncharacterized protein (TIGR00255 family)